jgi:hypothetical protein
MTYDWHKRFHAHEIDVASKVCPATFGLYCLLIDHVHLHGCPLVDDDVRIAGTLGVHWRSWRTAKQELLAVNAIIIVDGRIASAEAMGTLSARHDGLMRRSEAGQKGAESRKNNSLVSTEERRGEEREERRLEQRADARASDFENQPIEFQIAYAAELRHRFAAETKPMSPTGQGKGKGDGDQTENS